MSASARRGPFAGSSTRTDRAARGRNRDAVEAKRIDLVSYVHPRADFDAKVGDVERIPAGLPMGPRFSKRLVLERGTGDTARARLAQEYASLANRIRANDDINPAERERRTLVGPSRLPWRDERVSPDPRPSSPPRVGHRQSRRQQPARQQDRAAGRRPHRVGSMIVVPAATLECGGTPQALRRSVDHADSATAARTSQAMSCERGTPNGIRTRAATLRGWCPRPLDDGGLMRTDRRAGRLCHFARGGGLEPPKAVPETAVLPITPPPKGSESVPEPAGGSHTRTPVARHDRSDRRR